MTKRDVLDHALTGIVIVTSGAGYLLCNVGLIAATATGAAICSGLGKPSKLKSIFWMGANIATVPFIAEASASTASKIYDTGEDIRDLILETYDNHHKEKYVEPEAEEE